MWAALFIHLKNVYLFYELYAARRPTLKQRTTIKQDLLVIGEDNKEESNHLSRLIKLVIKEHRIKSHASLQMIGALRIQAGSTRVIGIIIVDKVISQFVRLPMRRRLSNFHHQYWYQAKFKMMILYKS